MLRGSTWMMLVGAVVLVLGVVFGSLSPPYTPRTLSPDESITVDVRANAGDWVTVAIRVRDPGPDVSMSTVIESPSGEVGGSGASGITSSWGYLIGDVTGVYTVVIHNVGRTVTIDYYVTATTSTEVLLVEASTFVVLTGVVLLLGGLALRFVAGARSS